MPSRAHEVLLVLVADDPSLLTELVERLRGKALPLPPGPSDSTVRTSLAPEVRPDMLFEQLARSWTALEVQLRVDPDKVRRWSALVGGLVDRHGFLGDLLVIASAPQVARWARRAVHLDGPTGSRLRFTPVVLGLHGRAIKKLLAPARPKLAFFAAWAMRRRTGPQAKRIVQQALDIAATLPEPLRARHISAILESLNDTLHQHFAESTMLIDIDKELARLEPPWMRKARLARRDAREKAELEAEVRAEVEAKVRAEVKAEVKAEVLLTFLDVRGVALSEADRRRVQECQDLATLDRWIALAGNATSSGEVFGPAQKPARRKRAAPREGGAARPVARR